MLIHIIESCRAKVVLSANKVIKAVAKLDPDEDNHVFAESELLWARKCHRLPTHLQYKILADDDDHVVIEMKRYRRAPRIIHQGEQLERLLSDILDQIIALNTIRICHSGICMRNIVMDNDRYLLINYGRCCSGYRTKKSTCLLWLFLTVQPERFPINVYWNPRKVFNRSSSRPEGVDCPLGILLWENRLAPPEDFRAVLDDYLHK